MRQFKVVLLGIGALALSFGTASAGLNPGNVGIPVKNNASAACIACHTVAPGGGAQQGSHFVFDPSVPTRTTNSGGGGTYGFTNAARTGGQYFKINQWTQSTGSAGYSKYGRVSDNASIAVHNDNGTYGAAVTVAAGTGYNTAQIICESCHNLIRNVAGGNNLLAPMAALSTARQTQVTGAASGAFFQQSAADEATLCVGCHGFMYATTVMASETGTNYADTRNTAETSAIRRGNNNAHYVNGVKYDQNHHVGTGDQIGTATAAAGLLWRDVLAVPTSGVTTVIGTVTGQTRGQMPQQATWVADGGKVKNAAQGGYLNCVMCHSAAHNGLNGTAASILRDTNAGGMALAARTVATSGERITRIGEGTRTWMSGYNDLAFCNDCHMIKP